MLVVEDQPTYRYIMRRLLERDAFEVDEAADLEHAVEQAQHTRPDAIVVDICLGSSGDGIDVVRAVKASHPGVKALLVSAMPQDYIDEHRTRMPELAFLGKDRLDQLAASIRKLLDGETPLE